MMFQLSGFYYKPKPYPKVAWAKADFRPSAKKERPPSERGMPRLNWDPNVHGLGFRGLGP